MRLVNQPKGLPDTNENGVLFFGIKLELTPHTCVLYVCGRGGGRGEGEKERRGRKREERRGERKEGEPRGCQKTPLGARSYLPPCLRQGISFVATQVRLAGQKADSLLSSSSISLHRDDGTRSRTVGTHYGGYKCARQRLALSG